MQTDLLLSNFEKAGISQADATLTEGVLSVFLHPKYKHGVLMQIIKKGIFDSTGRISGKIVEKESGHLNSSLRRGGGSF